MGSVNDIYLLQVRGDLAGQEYVHTLHFKGNLLGTDASIQQALIDAWQAAAQNAWRALHTSAYTLNDITAQRVCGTTPLPAASIETVNLAGTRAGVATEALAPWLCALCREQTAFAGRRYRGRFFVSGLYEGDVVGTGLVAGYTTLVSAYLTALAPFLAGGSDVDWDLFVRSRVLAGTPGVACQDTGAPVTNLSVSAFLTSLRSRRSRTGA